MKFSKISHWCALTLLVGVGIALNALPLAAQKDPEEPRPAAKAKAPADDPAEATDAADAKDPAPEGRDAAESTEGVEVLTRGPVHEAFAGTISSNPEPGIEVTKAPPQAIEELPPEQSIDGENVAWIPGYWAWDDDRDDFLWVSGIWRALPPGRQWVPGYWMESEQGHVWTTGYWADAKVTEVQYLPQPPESLDEGPNVKAPSPDQIWVPGTWVWVETRYAWQPGYWVSVEPNWVWIPSYYCWAPHGWIFVNGYFDYVVPRRGILFAPVYFDSVVYSSPAFRYSPAVVINVNVFVNQLFVRPLYHHYYFGDYYAVNYTQAGFYPWFSVYEQRVGYDPIFAYARWEHRRDRNWESNIQASFKERVDNEDARPARTFADQQKIATSGVASKQSDLVVATSLATYAKSQDSPLKLRAVKQDERQKFADQGKQIQTFRAERQKLEAEATDAATTKSDKGGKEGARPTMKMPKSPVVARASEGAGQGAAPPKPPKVPEADTKTEPKARKTEDGTKPSESATQPRTPRPGTRRNTDAERDPTTTKPSPKPGSRTEPSPKPEPRPKPETKPETKPEPKPKPEVKPETKPEPKPKPETKPEPKPETKPEPKPEPKPRPEPKPETKPEPKPQPKPETKPEPKPQPKTAPEPKPMPKPKVEPKPVPMPKKKPQPKPEPKESPEPKPPETTNNS